MGDIIARLVRRNAVDNPDKWVISAKEAGTHVVNIVWTCHLYMYVYIYVYVCVCTDKTSRFVLPKNAAIGSFLHMNMNDLIFKPGDEKDVEVRIIQSKDNSVNVDVCVCVCVLVWWRCSS